jgi:hypothetical protein
MQDISQQGGRTVFFRVMAAIQSYVQCILLEDGKFVIQGEN